MKSAPIDLQEVKRLFSDLPRHVQSQFLRREISKRMQEKLALIKITPQSILDAGCGEGDDIAFMQKRFDGARLIGLDAAHARVQQAKLLQSTRLQQIQSSLARWLPVMTSTSRPTWLCGNFLTLPVANQSIDLLWSNLALHWHPEPHLVFNEWHRVLREDGLLMFSCFGPDTLKEVRNAFSQVDSYPHTLNFVDMHDLGDMLVNAGFATPVMDMETLHLTYTDPVKLLQDVRILGGLPLETKRKGLLGRQQFDRVLQALGAKRDTDNRIRLSIEVNYGHAFKPQATKTAAGESIIRFKKR